ncbi:MAG: hypothetical protein ABSH06_27705 [Thermodesulfobacteriota bacterium]
MGSLTTFHGNADFVRMLIDAQVEFLVVGGLAAVFHKCRDPQKVDDLDLFLNPSAGNIERFISVISSPNLKRSYNLELHPFPSVQQLARPNLDMPLKFEPMLCVDILTPSEDANFSELFSRSQCASLNGSIPVRIISRQDLAEMKRRAIRMLSKDKKKHEDDLRCLEVV